MVKNILITLALTFSVALPKPALLPGDTLFQLKQIGFQQPLNLHLGCGETTFVDSVNIDFSPEDHVIQPNNCADVCADITTLSFPNQSVRSIRSHHLFEHFDRTQALALLCAWHWWLEKDGTLIIETPDIEASFALFMNQNTSYFDKQKILRHVFGSHEAHWALHKDGWYHEKFKRTLESLGFRIVSVKKTAWQATRNIVITAKKTTHLSQEQLHITAAHLLSDSLIDLGKSEQLLLDAWIDLWKNNVKKMIDI